MKKILIVLVVLLLTAMAGIVGGVWYLRSGLHFGIDADHPLGSLGKVERAFVSIGLEKDEAALNSIRKALLDRQVVYYVEALPEGADREPDRVTVSADGDGVVREFTAELRKDPDSKGLLPSVVRTLCEYYWNAAGGRTPKFESGEPEREAAEVFTRERVGGRWTRTETREHVLLRIR